MSNHPTCTIVIDGEGHKCGAPAIRTFESVWKPGEILAECADHYINLEPHGQNIGDLVDVQRHGCTYVGQVVRVTRTGKVFAQVTYKNGATRVVEV